MATAPSSIVFINKFDRFIAVLLSGVLAGSPLSAIEVGGAPVAASAHVVATTKIAFGAEFTGQVRGLRD